MQELFDIYIAREDYRNATAFLSQAALLRDELKVENEKRLQLILNLITAYLELKEHISCEPLLLKAHELAAKIKSQDLLIQYNYCCAQYYNLTRKFQLSAMRYYAACNIESASIPAEQVAEMLSRAIDATILSPVGSKKAFLVANLMKDDRSKSFKNHAML